MIHRRKDYLIGIMICTLGFSVTGCSGVADDARDVVLGTNDYISFCPSLSNNGVPSGENAYNGE